MISVDKDICVGCGGCISGYDGSNGCMYDALSLSESSVNIDTSKCMECGKCVQLCGLGALSIAE
jgi:heterodisulfide reductase subunit A-like polyferredoxin